MARDRDNEPGRPDDAGPGVGVLRRDAPVSGSLRFAQVSRVPDQLDVAVAGRLRQVVAGQAASESELRTLAEQAEGWARATEARLRAAERRLSELNADPATPLTKIAAEVRRAEALSRELEQARRLIAGLERRTRELRTAWLKRHAESGSPWRTKR